MNCIYCGIQDDKLSVEHIIPEGLGGNQVLINASCASCRDKTSRFEYRVLRQSYGLRAVRSILHIGGKRRPKEKPTNAPVQLETVSGRTERLVPLAHHPLPLVLPLFESPSALSNSFHPAGIRVRGYHSYSANTTPTATLEYLGEEKTYVRVRNYDHDFAMLLAKIAFCSWVATFGIHNLSESWLPPVILGKEKAAGKYVGTYDYALKGLDSSPCLHSVHLSFLKHETGWISTARIQLFLQLNPCPTYIVLIGRLKENVKFDRKLEEWALPTQGMFGDPLTEKIPKWVGTTFIGKPENSRNDDILSELRTIGLIE